jgi:hypothetical protein
MPPVIVRERAAGRLLSRDSAEAGHARQLIGETLDGQCQGESTDCAILAGSKLFFPRFGSVSSQIHPGSPSYLPAGGSRRQKHASSLLLHGLKASRGDQQSTQGRGRHLQAARRQQ